MADSTSSSFLDAVEPYLQFFIGIFGALAIIGVFFKIQGYPNTELFMVLGFMGEAAAFVLMGSFVLLSHYFGPDQSQAEGGASGEVVAVEQQPPPPSQAAAVGQEMRATAREMVEERLREDLDDVMEALTHEVRRFGEEMREMSNEMEHTRSTLGQMHEALGPAADGRLAEQADVLGDRMEQINAQLRQSGAKIEEGHAALERMEASLSRAADGALPEDAERLEEGMKALGAEVHAMSSEMGPARAAVERMRGELEQVTSGRLAENADRLGEGMDHLSGEMEGAGEAVERLRSDLDEVAARFQRFNGPVGRSDGTPNGNASDGDTSNGEPTAAGREDSRPAREA
jgi:predicted  nucleic acid-binding Zn-ribbon protein